MIAFQMTQLLLLISALGLCPDVAQHETPRDCPWAALARAARVDVHAIAEDAPKLWSDIARDAGESALHAAWGQSRNFDEHEHATIVDAAILSAIGKRLGVAGDGQVVHAGLQHTYGYLFSTLWTAFGYKRARWIDGALERGLRLPPGLLGPTPTRGTLYANVTCALARLTSMRALDATCARVAAPEIAKLSRAHEALLEHAGAITLRTDLVPLGEGFLLIYSSRGTTQRLLTSFPIDRKMADSVRATTGPIVARYNAFVPGLANTGTREVVSAP